jgi:xanthine dehydrogenase accessory factor
MIEPIAQSPAQTLPDDAFDWPVFGLPDDVRPALRRAVDQGAPAALATLYAVEGGAPRGVGAQMVYAAGELSGFLSGGCVEADVARHALDVLSERRPRRLVYGEGGPPDVRLACGSRIEVLIEAVEPGDLALRELLALAEARRPALWLSDGETRACIEPGRAAALPAPLRALADAEGLSGALDEPFAVFRRFAPALRLVVIGSDPIALALLKFAAAMGVEAVLVRPKGPEAAPGIPLAAYARSDAAAALAALRPDPWTAITVLSHDADLEHAALNAALSTHAGYIGALGSRRRIPERNQRLAEAGATADDLARIRAPIGLPIGGKSPWEIAVSILAEIVAQSGD